MIHNEQIGFVHLLLGPNKNRLPVPPQKKAGKVFASALLGKLAHHILAGSQTLLIPVGPETYRMSSVSQNVPRGMVKHGVHPMMVLR